MNLAEPAKPSSPAMAEVAPSVTPLERDKEYQVEPAMSTTLDKNAVSAAPKVDIATEYDDARKLAPTKQLDEPFVKKDKMLSPADLMKTGGVDFAGPAAISRGVTQSCARKCLPFLFDPRDFISYGEALRYVVVKDGSIFVYTEETDIYPLYNIPLGSLRPVKENPKKPHKASVTISPMTNTNLQKQEFETVVLVDARNTLAHQFTFDVGRKKDSADEFLLAVENVNSDVKQEKMGLSGTNKKKMNDKVSSTVEAKVI